MLPFDIRRSPGGDVPSPTRPRHRLWLEITWEIAKRLITAALIMILASVAAEGHWLKVFGDKWDQYAWGVSQNLTAAAILVIIEGAGLMKFIRFRRLVEWLRATLQTALDKELASVDPAAIQIGTTLKPELQAKLYRMISVQSRMRERLQYALGKISETIPKSDRDIDF